MDEVKTLTKKTNGIGISAGSLVYKRYFTQEGKNVYDMFEWEKGKVDIIDDDGNKLFDQEVEFPKQWSGLARKMTASKYFYGEQNTPKRESSFKSLSERVSETFYDWAIKQNYFSSEKEARAFSDELKYLTLDQRMAFNSPVWFNVGAHKINGDGSDAQKESYIIQKNKIKRMPLGKERAYPQTSACFIQSVDDTMESIMTLSIKEALLFKYGSGTGTNLSTLRSSKELVSGGGRPSGPLAYWAFYDKVAGIVKSGGISRRAAKMDILNINHPDILEFIDSKRKEEEKLHILIDNGIPWREAQESVNYQNTNISVRASDEFMAAVEKGEKWKTKPVHNLELAEKMPEYEAKSLMRRIAENTHFCGDPGMQFDTTINKWHTCPNSGKINASNPCSEYMFLDNSSCNLASLNLMKFFNTEKNTFDILSFTEATRTTAIAQDLLIDNSSYPSKEIAENSHKFRPLGMGYANLGSLIMNLTLAYDSDEARAIAGAITALQTAKVYETSTELAEKLGAFKEYKKNKKPMLKVMQMHKEALKNIQKDKLPKGLENILDEAERTWENVIKRGEKYGFRNAQATVLAPTGTIGFMMECYTKGVEPEIGLVQTKILADGGIIRLVNNNVEPALKKLGYMTNEINDIKNYINGHRNSYEREKKIPHLKKEHKEKFVTKELLDIKTMEELKSLGYTKKQIQEIKFFLGGYETMEGAPHIKEEHLPIFDCANKPRWAKRTISPQGHIKMLAATQPFISGAISKTVNLPEEITIEEIEQTYTNAWKMGLKSVALYRDNSKRVQPLNFSKSLEEKINPTRRKLSSTAPSIRHKFNVDGHEGYLHIGLYEDASPGELFITMSKEGSTIGGLMDAIGTLTSISLQYGVPLENIVKKMRYQNFEPRGLVSEGHPEIHTADSILDYISHFMEKEFLQNGIEEHAKQTNNNKNKEEEKQIQAEEQGIPGGNCPICGDQMYKKGSCEERCNKCDHVDSRGCGG